MANLGFKADPRRTAWTRGENVSGYTPKGAAGAGLRSARNPDPRRTAWTRGPNVSGYTPQGAANVPTSAAPAAKRQPVRSNWTRGENVSGYTPAGAANQPTTPKTNTNNGSQGPRGRRKLPGSGGF